MLIGGMFASPLLFATSIYLNEYTREKLVDRFLNFFMNMCSNSLKNNKRGNLADSKIDLRTRFKDCGHSQFFVFIKFHNF